MKKEIIITVLALSSLFELVAQGNQGCINNTSTNPMNPLNSDFLQMIVQHHPGTTLNSFLSTGFNWYNNPDDAIIINKSPYWQMPRFSSGANSDIERMLWPWHTDMPFTYLHQRWDYSSPNPKLVTIDEDARDFRWEDGWELLWMNLGIYPNGIKNDRNRIINVHRI